MKERIHYIFMGSRNFSMLQSLQKFIAVLILTNIGFMQGVSAADQNRLKIGEHFINNVLHTSPNISSEPPSIVTGTPTEVKFGLYINGISSVNEQDMTLTYSGYHRLGWNDPRMAFDKSEYGVDELKIPDGYWQKIWVPDVFMRNVRENTLHETVREHALLKVKTNGDLWFVFHATAKVSCPMNLQRFPFDTQSCPIMLESFGHTADEFYLAWLKNPVTYDVATHLPGFQLRGTDLYDCSMNYTAGAFPCLEIRFILVRDSGFYWLQVFLPTILFVVIAWFSLWVDIQLFSHRMLLQLLLLLLLMSLYAVINAEMPRVSYMKAIDVWMSVSTLFIFLIMAESTIVKAIAGRSSSGTNGSNATDDKVGTSSGGDYAMLLGRVYSPSSATNMVDLCARISFPILYFLFIVIYFSLYAS